MTPRVVSVLSGVGRWGEEEFSPGVPECWDDVLAQKSSIHDLGHHQIDPAETVFLRDGYSGPLNK